MNILFIFPLNEPFNSIISANKTAWKSKLNRYKNIKKLDCVYPTGLLSISTYIKKHFPDINIKILDFNAVMVHVAQRKYENSEDFENYKIDDFIKESLSYVDGFTPDIIGISTLFCSNYHDLKPLSLFLRNKYSDSLITCGGHMVSSLYGQIFKDSMAIDAVSFGEGEIPFVELIEAFLLGKEQEYLSSSSSWITKNKLKLNKEFVPQGKVIIDLDEIPVLDFSVLIFPDIYFNSTRYFFVIDSQENKKEVFIFSTRGCPYSCVFCASQAVHGHRIRLSSAEKVKNDILFFNKNYGVTRFIFYDDHFLIDKKRAIEILEFVAKNNFIAEIPTPAFFSINKEVAVAMRLAGIKEVNITIESGNENTFKNIIHKPGSLQMANNAVDILHSEGIVVVSNILTGLPGETKKSIDQGINYLLTTNIDWFQCFVVAPLPGSELYEICVKNGYLVKGYDISTMDYKKGFIKTKDFTPKYIENKVYEMNLMLNFVKNRNIRMGNYKLALSFFERIINSVIDTHAFAYYFAAKCCEKLKLNKKYETYKKKYEEIIKEYPFWKKYSVQFKLKKLK